MRFRGLSIVLTEPTRAQALDRVPERSTVNLKLERVDLHALRPAPVPQASNMSEPWGSGNCYSNNNFNLGVCSELHEHWVARPPGVIAGLPTN